MEPHHFYFDSAVQDNNSSPPSIASPIWLERDRCSMQRVQNNFIRTVFSRSYSPNIESCQVLPPTGVPPIDILSMSINIKFLIKVKFANDLLAAAHDSSAHVVANLLETHRSFDNF